MSTMLILILAGVAFIVWHFLPEPKPPGPQPRFRRDPFVRPADPAWQERIEQQCESPAEVAFLRAMIKAHDLKPDAGMLIGNKIKIDLQVEEGRYRVDFLANEWLVIEIDGAAWHSSDEAVERDRVRDEYFLSLGYSVVRIPAKTVFNRPLEAVQKVDTALRVGRRVIVTSPGKSGFVRLSETMVGASRLMSEINNQTTRLAALRKALQPTEMAIHSERTIISAALESAKRNIALDEFLADDPIRQKAYAESRERLKRQFEKYDKEKGHVSLRRESIQIKAIPNPIVTDDEQLNVSIQEGYQSMLDDRTKFLVEIRRQIAGNPTLGNLVRRELESRDAREVIDLIT